MDILSQELIDLISSHLAKDDLKNTLLVSRKFQYSAEQQSGTFESITLTANEESARNFLSIYSTHRFRFLKKVVFETTVGSDDPWDEELAEHECRDTAAELRVMDEEFTNQIHFLFTTLNTLDKTIDALHNTSKRLHLEIFTPMRQLFICYHRKFCSWRIHLLSPSTLPNLPIVQFLEFVECTNNYPGLEGPFARKVDHRVILDLAIKCPNLEKLYCSAVGNEWAPNFVSQGMTETCQDHPGPRRDSRHDFGRPLLENEGLLPPNLRDVRLNFLCRPYWAVSRDDRLALPDLVKPALFDPLSSSLRILSIQLRKMNLQIMADKTLFWPADSSEAVPSWPNMESMNIKFYIAHPSGSWYFEPPIPNSDMPSQGFDITDEHYPPFQPTEQDMENDRDRDIEYFNWDRCENFTCCHVRVRPNDKELTPFLSSFAKAAARMHSLREFAIWAPIKFEQPEELPGYEDFDYTTVSKYVGPQHHPELAWGIAYAAPGEQDFTVYPKGDCSPNRRIWWRVGAWRPDPEFHGLFENVGCKEHDGRLVEYWNDEDGVCKYPERSCGNGLGYRSWFTEWEDRRWGRF